MEGVASTEGLSMSTDHILPGVSQGGRRVPRRVTIDATCGNILPDIIQRIVLAKKPEALKSEHVFRYAPIGE